MPWEALGRRRNLSLFQLPGEPWPVTHPLLTDAWSQWVVCGAAKSREGAVWVAGVGK